MPCTDPIADAHARQEEKALRLREKEALISKVNKLTAMLCKQCAHLEEYHYTEDLLIPAVDKWYTKHKADDETYANLHHCCKYDRE